LLLDSERIDYTLIRVAGRRHVHLLIENGDLLIRTPWRGNHGLAEEAIREHAGWVRSGLKSARERLRNRPALADGTLLPLLDDCLRLSVRPAATSEARPRGRHRRVRVCRSADHLIVWPRPHTDEALRETVERWYRGEAQRLLPGRLAVLAAPLGHTPSRIRIAGQRRRWGSCSGRGTISLNWRLLLLPAALADYVMIHELCHLRHLDHSPRFWSAVECAMPDYRGHRARLKAVEGNLPL